MGIIVSAGGLVVARRGWGDTVGFGPAGRLTAV
jgi:hypothetical protein